MTISAQAMTKNLKVYRGQSLSKMISPMQQSVLNAKKMAAKTNMPGF